MRRYILTVLAFMLSLSGLSAQDSEPTTTWPYIYSDFKSGELKPLSGAPIQGAFNIHVLESRLHFIEDGMIREMKPSEILSVKVGMTISQAYPER